MKKLTFAFICIWTCLANSVGVQAQSSSYSANAETDLNAVDSTKLHADEIDRINIIKNTQVIRVGGNDDTSVSIDSIQSLINKFYMDQFRNSQDPDAPYFTFISKDANLAMGVGGTLKATAWFDWNGIVDGAAFSTYNILPKTDSDRKNLGASPTGTSIFFNIMARHTFVGDFRAYIEAGFSGTSNNSFKLKAAWFMIHDFTVGYTKSTFSDPGALPNVLDPAGSNGKIDKKNMLVRYLKTWKNRWTVAAGVELANQQIDFSSGYTAKIRNYIPDFALLGQYQWNRGLNHVRLSGLLRSMPYRNLIDAKNTTVTGWGVQLLSVVAAWKITNFYGIMSYGRGVSSYTGDLSQGNYDLLDKTSAPGELYAPRTISASFGVRVRILPKLTTNLALSTLRHFAEGSLKDDKYKYGQYLAINAIYNFTPRIKGGVEYLAGKRKNFDGHSLNANRVLAQVVFSF